MNRASKVIKIAVILAVLLCVLAGNRINNLEGSEAPVQAELVRNYSFDFETVRPNGPRLNLRSAILVNYDNGDVLYAKNAEMVHPIASISKIVAAMVIFDKVTDFRQLQTVSKEDAFKSSFSRLRPGYQMSLDDLLHTALIISDNRATRALARATSGSIEAFVADMNAKMKELGMEHTVFFDPTGLDNRNVSTAHEVAKILHHAYRYSQIAEITSLKFYNVRIKRGKRTFAMQLRNTNRLMDSPYHVLTGKTGYIEAAAYCLTTMVENNTGEKLTLVVLGAPTGGTRFREARKLANWGFKELLKEHPVPAPMADKDVEKKAS